MNILKMGGSKVAGPVMLLLMVPALPFCVAGASTIFLLERSGLCSLKKTGDRLCRVSHKLSQQLNSFAEECAQSFGSR